MHLSSDSPALNGSRITFTAKLEYPPCQKEDANGDLVWDEHCEDGTELEASGAARAPPGHAPSTSPIHQNKMAAQNQKRRTSCYELKTN